MKREDLDREFDAADKRQSAAITSKDASTVRAATTELLRIAHAITEMKTSAGKSHRLTPEQGFKAFFAARHRADFAEPGDGGKLLIAFADEALWLESIGYELSAKERRIVDELPFMGVKELFLRWKTRVEENGYGPNIATNIKIIFEWLRAHPEEPTDERLITFLAENINLDRQWFPFYYGELLSKAGRGAEQEPVRTREAKEKPTSYRRWVALAECYAAVPRRVVACLAKALMCTILPAEEAPVIRASLEKRLRAAGQLIGRTAPTELSEKALAKLAAPTEEFLLADATETDGVFAAFKTDRVGNRLAVIRYKAATGDEVTVTRPLTEDLAKLGKGAPLKIYVGKRGDTDIIVAVKPVIVIQPPPTNPRKQDHKSRGAKPHNRHQSPSSRSGRDRR